MSRQVDKKVVKRAMVWLLLLLLLLPACGGKEDPGVSPTSLPTSTPTVTPVPPDAPVPARILNRGVLAVGVRYDLPPFSSVQEDGTLAGFDIALGRELARRWLGDPNAVRFQQVRSDTAADHILAGDVDLVLTPLLHTQEAEERVDFGPSLFEDGQALLIRASDGLSITTPLSLEGRLVGIVAGSGADDALAATLPFTVPTASFPTFEQALDALVREEVDCVADLRRRLVRGLARTPGTLIAGQYSEAYLDPAYAPNDPGMANLVALTLQDLFADGTYETLYRQWFPGDEPPTPEVWPGRAMVSIEEAAQPVQRLDTRAAIRARGQLRVAMVANRYPFAYLDENGEAAGYEVQLARQLAGRWLEDQTAVVFVPVSLEEGKRMVTSGGADLLIGGVRRTREAEVEMDLSLPIYEAGEGLMVLAGGPAGLASLDGQVVAVVAGTESGEIVRQAAQAAGISIVVRTVNSLEEGMTALQAGEVAAVAGERADLLGPAYMTPGVGVTADRLTRAPLVMGLPPGDSAFRDLVNLTLQGMNWDGSLSGLYTVWFDDDPPHLSPWPGQPLNPLKP